MKCWRACATWRRSRYRAPARGAPASGWYAIASTPSTPMRARVRLESGQALPFDRLVVAPGIRFLSERLEGYDAAAAQRMPHAWQAGEQTWRLAAQLRAMDDGGVVAISVPSGLMRCPPAPYERASLIAHYLSQHKPRSKLLILRCQQSFSAPGSVHRRLAVAVSGHDRMDRARPRTAPWCASTPPA